MEVPLSAIPSAIPNDQIRILGYPGWYLQLAVQPLTGQRSVTLHEFSSGVPEKPIMIWIEEQTPPPQTESRSIMDPRSGAKVAVPPSLQGFNIIVDPTPQVQRQPTQDTKAALSTVPVLISPAHDTGGVFKGRRCKECDQDVYHVETCPAIVGVCDYCDGEDGAHRLSCEGFEV